MARIITNKSKPTIVLDDFLVKNPDLSTNTQFTSIVSTLSTQKIGIDEPVSISNPVIDDTKFQLQGSTGVPGQVLTSRGSGASPAWTFPAMPLKPDDFEIGDVFFSYKSLPFPT